MAYSLLLLFYLWKGLKHSPFGRDFSSCFPLCHADPARAADTLTGTERTGPWLPPCCGCTCSRLEGGNGPKHSRRSLAGTGRSCPMLTSVLAPWSPLGLYWIHMGCSVERSFAHPKQCFTPGVKEVLSSGCKSKLTNVTRKYPLL